MADTLVLNADGQPISYLPLSAIQWKEAITYIWLDKCNVLEWYDDWVVSSPSWETRVPAIIMLKEMMRRRRTPKFSKSNIYLRDLYTCQYCLNTFPRNAKGNKLHPMPRTKPYQPDYYELVSKRKQMDFEVKHPSWEMFLK